MGDAEFDGELEALQQGQKRKRTWMLIGGAGVLLLGGGAVAVTMMQMAATNQARMAEAWSRASTCVVGDPVDGPDAAAAKFRNSQLAAMGYPLEKRSEPGEKAWPQRCSLLLHGVAEALELAGKTSPLTDSSKALATALDDPESFSKDTSERVAQVWKDAQELGLTAAAVGGPRPLDVASPLTQDSLPESALFLPGMIPLESLKTESTPSGRLMFVVDAKDQPNLPALCTSQPQTKRLACKKLPENLKRVSPGLELFGTSQESVPPFLFAGDRGTAGVYRSSDGKQIAQGLTYGASALEDGSLVRTIWNEKKKEVWYAIHPPVGETKETKLLAYEEVGNPYYNSGLFWDWLVYKAWVDGNIQLLTRKVKPGGELEKIERVGELRQRSLIVPGEKRPHITACRTSQAFVVRVKGSHEQYTAFHLDDGWKPPVASRGTEGELTCSETEAVITDLVPQMPEPWIYQTRCTPAACQRSEVGFKQMLRDVPHLKPQDRKHLAAAELGGRLLILWGAGERGGLRMRLAPADHILKTKDQILFDDLVDKGKHGDVSTLLATRLISGSKYALLFLSTVRGVFVFHVDAEGAVSPVTTVFE